MISQNAKRLKLGEAELELQRTGGLDSKGETGGCQGSKSTRKVVTKNKRSIGFTEPVCKKGQKLALSHFPLNCCL